MSTPSSCPHRTSCTLRAALLGLLLASLSGCNDLDRFDTKDGSRYCGQITDGRFVREGFERQLGLELRLDVDRLQTVPGEISTFDDQGACQPQALFHRSALRVPQAILADPLSGVDLGESREYTFMAWAQSSCQGAMLTVVSLMQNGEVEVRLLSGPDPSEPDGRFGVFHLTRQPSCDF